jgi:hypothetical protein
MTFVIPIPPKKFDFNRRPVFSLQVKGSAHWSNDDCKNRFDLSCRPRSNVFGTCLHKVSMLSKLLISWTYRKKIQPNPIFKWHCIFFNVRKWILVFHPSPFLLCLSVCQMQIFP